METQKFYFHKLDCPARGLSSPTTPIYVAAQDPNFTEEDINSFLTWNHDTFVPFFLLYLQSIPKDVCVEPAFSIDNMPALPSYTATSLGITEKFTPERQLLERDEQDLVRVVLELHKLWVEAGLQVEQLKRQVRSLERDK